MRMTAFPALLAAAALAFGNPAALAQQQPPSPPPNVGDRATFDSLLAKTIWPATFEALFGARFDVWTFWCYPLNAPLDLDPADYHGQNQYGHAYTLHVLEVLDLGRAGRFSDLVDRELGRPRTGILRMWGAVVAIETPLATIATMGIVAERRESGVVDARYIPAHLYTPLDEGADFDHGDCAPPPIPDGLCDALPDCESGALQYLDSVCGARKQKQFTRTCERAWRDYDQAMTSASAKWSSDIESCFKLAAVGYTGSLLLSFVLAGIPAVVGALTTTVALDVCQNNADAAYELEKDKARNKRDNSIADAREDFDDSLGDCCEDCPPDPGGKPPTKRNGPEPKRKP